MATLLGNANLNLHREPSCPRGVSPPRNKTKRPDENRAFLLLWHRTPGRVARARLGMTMSTQEDLERVGKDAYVRAPSVEAR